jgi:putative transposase
MPRIARVEAVGFPHHVIQRGNRRQKVFLRRTDKQEYLNILKLQAELFDLKVWAYCLMDNHVHLIVVPGKEGSLTKGIGETNRLYTRMINFRERWRGYLWQGRFRSFPMDSDYLYYCVRYVERNPVRAGLVKRPEEYHYSSAKSHIKRIRDPLLALFYLHEEIRDWRKYLKEPDDEQRIRIFHKHILTGRPLGKESFVKKLEKSIGRILRRTKPGPRKR